MFDSETPAAAGIALSNLDQLTDDERQLGNALDLEREHSGALVLDLDQIADLIDNGRTDEALRLIANARTKQLAKVSNQQTRWLKHAVAQLKRCDSLISVGAKALREQGCDIDTDVAYMLEEVVWPALHKARRAIAITLRPSDPDWVEAQFGRTLDVPYDEEERFEMAHAASEVAHG